MTGQTFRYFVLALRQIFGAYGATRNTEQWCSGSRRCFFIRIEVFKKAVFSKELYYEKQAANYMAEIRR
jgi:hypothetical protein